MEYSGYLKGPLINDAQKKEAEYSLQLGEHTLELKPLLGKRMSFEFLGKIRCNFCEKGIPKTYSNGSCYQCFISLPANDFCILKPESCHFHKGSCRNSVWGEDHCFIKHSVYLSYTTNLKVGITRNFRLSTRWLEQGALGAVELARVNNRLQAGLVEVALKDFVTDKTNWRKLLQQPSEVPNLEEKAQELKNTIKERFHFAQISQEEPVYFSYPILSYPKSTTTYNLEKTSHFEDRFIGLRGSYMLFEHGAFSMKKFKGFEAKVKVL